MNGDDIQEFISTFAQLYSQIVLNEPSKQIVEEFVNISAEMMVNFKKIVITEISTLYPALLISHKINKLAPLLFTGTEQELSKKILVLLLKK